MYLRWGISTVNPHLDLSVSITSFVNTPALPVTCSLARPSSPVSSHCAPPACVLVCHRFSIHSSPSPSRPISLSISARLGCWLDWDWCLFSRSCLRSSRHLPSQSGSFFLKKWFFESVRAVLRSNLPSQSGSIIQKKKRWYSCGPAVVRTNSVPKA